MNVELANAQWVSLAVSVVAPLLVGLATNPATPARVKAGALLVLNALNGVVTDSWGEGNDLNPETAAAWSLVVYGTSVLMHFGLWRPTGATAAAQRSLVTPRGRHRT